MPNICFHAEEIVVIFFSQLPFCQHHNKYSSLLALSGLQGRNFFEIPKIWLILHPEGSATPAKSEESFYSQAPKSIPVWVGEVALSWPCLFQAHTIRAFKMYSNQVATVHTYASTYIKLQIFTHLGRYLFLEQQACCMNWTKKPTQSFFLLSFL